MNKYDRDPKTDWLEMIKTTVTGIVMIGLLYVMLLLGHGFGF